MITDSGRHKAITRLSIKPECDLPKICSHFCKEVDAKIISIEKSDNGEVECLDLGLYQIKKSCFKKGTIVEIGTHQDPTVIMMHFLALDYVVEDGIKAVHIIDIKGERVRITPKGFYIPDKSVQPNSFI